jgi:hypothetical protein
MFAFFRQRKTSVRDAEPTINPRVRAMECRAQAAAARLEAQNSRHSTVVKEGLLFFAQTFDEMADRFEKKRQ